jgi:hypothetical protein
LAIGAVALTAFLVLAIIQFRGDSVAGPVPHVFLNIVETANRVDLGWVALALVASFVPTRLVLTRI